MPLGNTILLKPGEIRKQIHLWRAGAPCRPSPGGVFTLEDSAVTTITVSYDIGAVQIVQQNTGPGGIDPTLIDDTTIIEPYGTALFGTDKDTHMVEFDLKRGTRATVTSIDGTFLASYPRVEGSLQPPLNLKFGAGRGTAPGGNALTRTLEIPETGSVKFIPNFAKSAILIAAGPAPAAVLVQRAAPGGLILSAVPLGQLEFEPAPVAAGALVWEVVGAPAPGPGEANPRVQFNLNLG